MKKTLLKEKQKTIGAERQTRASTSAGDGAMKALDRARLETSRVWRRTPWCAGRGGLKCVLVNSVFVRGWLVRSEAHAVTSSVARAWAAGVDLRAPRDGKHRCADVTAIRMRSGRSRAPYSAFAWRGMPIPLAILGICLSTAFLSN